MRAILIILLLVPQIVLRHLQLVVINEPTPNVTIVGENKIGGTSGAEGKVGGVGDLGKIGNQMGGVGHDSGVNSVGGQAKIENTGAASGNNNIVAIVTQTAKTDPQPHSQSTPILPTQPATPTPTPTPSVPPADIPTPLIKINDAQIKKQDSTIKNNPVLEPMVPALPATAAANAIEGHGKNQTLVVQVKKGSVGEVVGKDQAGVKNGVAEVKASSEGGVAVKEVTPTTAVQNSTQQSNKSNVSAEPQNITTPKITTTAPENKTLQPNVTLPIKIQEPAPVNVSVSITPVKVVDNLTSNVTIPITLPQNISNVANITVPAVPVTPVKAPEVTPNVTVPPANVTVNVTVPVAPVKIPDNVTIPVVPAKTPENITANVSAPIPANVTLPQNTTKPVQPVQNTTQPVQPQIPSVLPVQPQPQNTTKPTSNTTQNTTKQVNTSNSQIKTGSSASSVITPPMAMNISEPVKLKDDPPLVLGLHKFGDSGLADDLIPANKIDDPAFRKIKSFTPITTILPQLLQLKSITRSFDGTGNNLAHPKFGSANSSQTRHCKANYIDNISIPVQALPSPRNISDIVGIVRPKAQLNKENVTLAFTIWGQFLDHDIEHSPSSADDLMHIPIPKCDKFFDADCNGTRVIPFSRSIFVREGSGPRAPINELTAWIDASMVYGASEEQAKKLRSFKEGKLKTDDTGRLLPTGKRVDEVVNTLLKNTTDKNISNLTMQAGDSRSNENLVLLSYQTLFLREHNRICDLLLRNTRALTDEEMYTIARNYVIGLIQKITYDDYLPIVLGAKAYKEFIGDYKGYDETVDPTIEVEFSAAGYRFGHSLLVSSFPMVNLYGDKLQFLRLDNSFFRPDLMSSVALERVLRGASRTITKLRDGEFVDQIRNLLILSPELRNIRMDLLSINIQRGRDQGIPGFNALRECYGLKRFTDFSEVSGESAKNQQMRSVYRSVDSIDSYVGIQTERALQGSILGQTGIAITGRQFQRIRNGDRFWYERAFPPQIVTEIKNTKLSQVILRNTAILELQDDVFHYHFGG